ncbi:MULTISPECIES: LysR substrate-binding domain-containing protein [Rhizobium]|uniref:LysR family transcriptional regulator n=1 Tax=Rhizobium dioscoreae TaxID=2653122 RepID=A0ABQ0Z786_9HYPH|nr:MULTISPECIES: LysR substrate-binding domain-containing protein [Rhizobium]MCZ3374972.1 LysR family transcriptional regulator [Rhizobium sp. AG207R]GES51237.1 LysR family transcriptional regulator [Rhizobium dioscoreae]
MNFRRRIPSLTALMTLEAVLRHRSFTAAAIELGVTQAAVSRQIATLEEELALPMFVRKHRAIEPTAACLTLGTTLAQSFASIADAVDVVRSSQQNVVTIGATVAFSSFWLLPRLTEFRRENAGVQIRVISQDARIDLDAGGIDVAIRYGRPPFADAKIVAAQEDVVVPVCSPDYYRRRPTAQMSDADEFIETDAHDRSWLSWTQWVQETGRALRIKPHLRFNHYTEAIAAARAGQGIALGWRLLVQTFLEDGTLVALEEPEISTPDRYHVLLPARPRLTLAAEHAAHWLANALTR